MFVAVLNTMILFPVWLGRMLPRLRTKYEEDSNSTEREALTVGSGNDKPNADESFVIEDDPESDNGIIT